MPVTHQNIFFILWLLWGLYWCVSSFGTKSAQKKESIASRVGHLGPLFVALLLLSLEQTPFSFPQWGFNTPPLEAQHSASLSLIPCCLRGFSFLNQRFFENRVLLFWPALALTIFGLLFTVWARITLGKNWSGIVTIKKDHALVIKGPYKIVRHPIYTGLLVALAGSAMALAEWRGVVAVVIAFFALLRKLRLEEKWLFEEFGTAYADYQKRVKALLPFVL